jgi:hypothetical protein
VSASLALGRRRDLSGILAERVARHRRRATATGLQRTLDDARRPAFWLSARAPVNRRQVLDAAPDIERLVARLRDDDRAVGDDCLRCVQELLTDADGPLLAHAAPGTLRQRVRVISEAVG